MSAQKLGGPGPCGYPCSYAHGLHVVRVALSGPAATFIPIFLLPSAIQYTIVSVKLKFHYPLSITRWTTVQVITINTYNDPEMIMIS